MSQLILAFTELKRPDKEDISKLLDKPTGAVFGYHLARSAVDQALPEPELPVPTPQNMKCLRTVLRYCSISIRDSLPACRNKYFAQLSQNETFR